MQDGDKECEWVIGFYTGDTAKRIKSLAAEGLGYYIRKEEKVGGGLRLEAAFRRPLEDAPRPNHLIPATPQQAAVLEAKRKKSQGIVF